jgi:LacI family transcriptional regulator
MPSSLRRSSPTIHDVASRAGVSPATVSRVVNETGQTAADTRERVNEVINEMGYRPSRTAKALSQGSTRTIAVAVPTFTTPFHNELLKGIRSRLKDVDADFLLCDLEWENPEASLVHFLERGTIDGLLAAGLPMNESLAHELEKLGGPTVLVGSRWNEIDSFYWDETAGARKATDHLIAHGHSRIGMITTHRDSSIRNARIQGYRDALTAAGLPLRKEWIATGHTDKHAGFSEESGYEAMQSLLRADPAVSAVFASSDVQAIGAWQALRQEGRSVPDDVAIIGYDDVKISRFIGLSSVAQNMHDIGEEATALLLRRLRGDGPAEPCSRLLVPEVVARASSGGPVGGE